MPEERSDERTLPRAKRTSDRPGRSGEPLWSSGYVDLADRRIFVGAARYIFKLRQFRQHLWFAGHASDADHRNDHPDDRRRIRHIDGRAVVGMSDVDRRIKCSTWLADRGGDFDGVRAGVSRSG